jgi:hypothetical protein
VLGAALLVAIAYMEWIGVMNVFTTRPARLCSECAHHQASNRRTGGLVPAVSPSTAWNIFATADMTSVPRSAGDATIAPPNRRGRWLAVAIVVDGTTAVLGWAGAVRHRHTLQSDGRVVGPRSARTPAQGSDWRRESRPNLKMLTGITKSDGTSSRGMQFEQVVRIARPVEEVFDFLADGANNPLWQPRVVRAWPLGTSLGVGTRFRQSVRHPLGFSFPSEYRLTIFGRPRIFRVVMSVDGLIRVARTYELTADRPDGTTVRCVLECQPAAARFAFPILAALNPLFGAAGRSLEAARDVLESSRVSRDLSTGAPPSSKETCEGVPYENGR